MVQSISTLNASADVMRNAGISQKSPVSETQSNLPKDKIAFGEGGKVGKDQAMGMVLERAYNKLKGVVDEARTALGIPEGTELDTSPEGTAQRIADFALGFFGKYAENHGLADDEAGRQQFADFIGQAITQGIDEARGILGALQVLDENIGAEIDSTASLIQTRLDDFVKNGLSG